MRPYVHPKKGMSWWTPAASRWVLSVDRPLFLKASKMFPSTAPSISTRLRRREAREHDRLQQAHLELIARTPPASDAVLSLSVERGVAHVAAVAAGRVAIFVEESDGAIDLLWTGLMSGGERWECPLPPTRGAVLAVYVAPNSARVSAPISILQAATAWRSRPTT